MLTPQHKHDCTDCRLFHQEPGLDAYLCGSEVQKYFSLLIRFDSGGGQYIDQSLSHADHPNAIKIMRLLAAEAAEAAKKIA